MLKNVRYEVSRSEGGDLLLREVFAPALSECSHLACWIPVLTLQDLIRSTYGLLAFIHGNGKARLMIRFDPIDDQGHGADGSARTPSQQLVDHTLKVLADVTSAAEKIRLGLIAWLLANDRLAISFVIPTGKAGLAGLSGLPPVISHVLQDDSCNIVTYSTSDSEELALKKLDVECRWSWGDPGKRGARLLQAFDRVWGSAASGVITCPLPPEVRTRIMTFLPVALPAEEPEILSQESEPQLSLYPHQEAALEKWKSNGFRGIFKMCTGAGKTISSLEGIRRLDKHLKLEGKPGLTTVVVVCPTQVLVEQWDAEVRDYGFAAPLLAYGSFNGYAHELVPALNQQEQDVENLRFVITTYATFAEQGFSGALHAMRGFGPVSGLLVADEMHRACTTRIRLKLKEYASYFQYRLGLSATPEIETDTSAERALFEYFSGIVAEYNLDDAIRDGVLCHYRYYPVPAPLDVETSKRYYKILKSMDDAERRGVIDINLYRERNDLIRNSDLAVRYFESMIDSKLTAGESMDHTLVYCPPGRTDYEEDANDASDNSPPETGSRRIEQIAAILQKRHISITAILGGDSRNSRKTSIDSFSSGKCDVLLGIGCLDEGLDIPNIREAIVLYSCDRERQFVQRRGRILRRASGKQDAIIRDIILLPQNSDMPPSLAEQLLKREMRRYNEFASLADNKADAERILSDALTASVSGN